MTKQQPFAAYANQNVLFPEYSAWVNATLDEAIDMRYSTTELEVQNERPYTD